MSVPTPEPTYYSTGRTRRAFLLGAGAAVVVAAGGLALWGTGVLAGDDETGVDGGLPGGPLPSGALPRLGDDAPPAVDREGPSSAGSDDEGTGEGGEPSGFTSVGMVGDSLTEGATPLLQEVLADRGVTELDVRGKRSRRIEVGDGGGAPLSGVRTLYGMLAEGLRPEAWVIALGTNDVGQYPGADDYRRLIDAMVTMLPEDQPLVWVDVYRPDRIEQSMLFNDLLRERLDARGNAVVADWFSRASDDELDILRSDGLHPNERGNLVFADLVGDALTRLADR